MKRPRIIPEPGCFFSASLEELALSFFYIGKFTSYKPDGGRFTDAEIVREFRDMYFPDQDEDRFRMQLTRIKQFSQEWKN